MHGGIATHAQVVFDIRHSTFGFLLSLGISSLGIFCKGSIETLRCSTNLCGNANGPVVAREEAKNLVSTDRHGAGKKGRTIFPRQQLFITSDMFDSL